MTAVPTGLPRTRNNTGFGKFNEASLPDDRI